MTASDIFFFKQFSIRHADDVMKVGRDSVLLGAWASCSSPPAAILDIGTGCGVLSLMLAQRYSTSTIHAVELSPEASACAFHNFQTSTFAKRISLHKCSIQEYVQTHSSPSFDLIVSNPPFFTNGNKAPSPQRSMARHTSTLPFDDLIKSCISLLAEEGSLCIVLPLDQVNHFSQKANSNGLFLHKKFLVTHAPSKPIKRVLLNYKLESGDIGEDCLHLFDDKGKITPKHLSLIRDFHTQTPQ